MKVVLIYIPVLHEGYRLFLEKHKKVDDIFVLADDVLTDVPYLNKEIRKLDQGLIIKALLSWGFKNVSILNRTELENLQKEKGFDVIMPDDDISRILEEKLFNHHIIKEPVFLRWDKNNTLEKKDIKDKRGISFDDFDKQIIKKIKTEADKSSDWWRRVGAAIVKDGEILSVAYNKHLPSEHTPYINGDPRNAFSKGLNIELSSAIHAEASTIAELAKKGVPLDGTVMYVSTFPCPVCAKLIANCGIKKVYYSEGYSMLDGEDVLKSKDVEIVHVDL